MPDQAPTIIGDLERAGLIPTRTIVLGYINTSDPSDYYDSHTDTEPMSLKGKLNPIYDTVTFTGFVTVLN